MIEVAVLTKRFGRTVAVDDLSFRCQPGAITGFLGPNGAGKTTTLRALLGLVRPDAGTATIGGQHYSRLDDPPRRVGAVLETSAFHPGRTGRNHLRVIARAAAIPESRVDEVLALVDLPNDGRRRVKAYSLGMRQRLALAAALLGDPEVLVLDEPANGLDPQGIRWLRDLLRAAAAEGRTVLVSSHLLAEVAQLADDVVIVDRGRFVTQSSVAEVTSGGAASTVVRSPDAERLRGLLAAAGVAAELRDGAMLAVRGAPPERVGEIAAANGVVLHELRAETATLEEAFLDLVGGSSAT